LGAFGEGLGAWFLTSHGLAVTERNLGVGRGEIDLIAKDGTNRVVIEVRTVTAIGDPIDAIDNTKRHRVTELSRRLGAHRTDYLGIGVRDSYIDFHWVPGSQ
jgi:putative endonuclease